MTYTDDAMTMSREKIDALQVKLLREALGRAKRAPAYHDKLADVQPEEITSLADVRSLPLTTKADLRAGLPEGFLAVDRAEVVRMHYSSGTTGLATAVYHTADDVSRWSQCVARGMLAAGLSRGLSREDIFQNMMGYGLFTGGLGFHYASELLGMMTIPAGTGNTERQLHLMQTFGSTALHIIPSYALRVLHVCEQDGLRILTKSAAASRRASARRSTTATGSRRCAGRGWRWSAAPRTGCTYAKTTTSRRYWTRRRWSRSRPASWASWS